MQFQIRPEESPGHAVIRAVAEVTDRDPLDLEPMVERVDPGVVDGMFTRSSGSGEGIESLTVFYEGCRVEVDTETVVVEEIPEA